MPYTISIRKPLLWWNYTRAIKAETEEMAAELLAVQLNVPVNGSEIKNLLGKELIIHNKKTITVTKQ